MNLSRITARGQTTIPKKIRDEAGLIEGDILAFEMAGEHLIVRKVAPRPDGYLQGLSETMTEWTSPEDEEAWRDL